VVDTGVDPARLEALVREYATVEFERRANLGGAPASTASSRASTSSTQASLRPAAEPDIELDPDFAAVLLDALEADPRVALASGKLLRPGRTVIDSAASGFRVTGGRVTAQ